MNKREILQEEIKFRKWVYAILLEEAVHSHAHRNPDILLKYMLLKEYDGVSGEGVISAFVDPFKEVFQVAKVAVKDLASIARFNFEMITTLSPSKQKEAKERFKNRNKELSKDWEKAMEPIDQVWQTGDMQLIGFMMNPAGFLGAKVASKAADTAEGAVELLDDAGWGIPFVTDFVRGDDAKSTRAGRESSKADDKGGGVVDVLGTGKKLLGDLTKLFFIAHHEPAGPLISEKKEGENPEKKKSGDAVAGVQQYMDKMPGLEDSITKSAKGMLDAKKAHVEEIMAMFNAQIKMLNGLSNAQDLKSFASVINQASQEGVDIGGAGLGNFQGEVDANVKKILGDEKSRAQFIKTYMEENNIAPPEGEEKVPDIPDEKLKPYAEKIVFMNSKTTVQEQLFTGTQALKKQVEEEIKSDVPDEKDWPLVSQTKIGKEYIGMIQSALQKVQSA